MNLKLPVKVTRKDFEKLIEYHRECGYKVEVEESKEAINATTSCPGYEMTPLANGVYDLCTRRWKLWMYIRLPERKPESLMKLKN